MSIKPTNKKKYLFDYGVQISPFRGVYNLLNEAQKEEVKRTVTKVGYTVPREALELSRMITKPSQETIQKQEEYLEDYLGYLIGSENVEMQERGEEEVGGYKVAAVKNPKSTLGEITAIGGGLVAGLVGAKKITEPLKFVSKKFAKKK